MSDPNRRARDDRPVLGTTRRMPTAASARKKRGSPAGPLSLYPLDFDAAIQALLQVKPIKHEKKAVAASSDEGGGVT